MLLRAIIISCILAYSSGINSQEIQIQKNYSNLNWVGAQKLLYTSNNNLIVIGNKRIDSLTIQKFIAKLESNGDTIWVTPLIEDEYIHDITVNDNNEILCVISANTTPLISKYTENGKLLWRKSISTPLIWQSKIIEDLNDNIHIICTVFPWQNIYHQTLNTQGEFLSDTLYEDIEHELNLAALLMDQNENLVVVGNEHTTFTQFSDLRGVVYKINSIGEIIGKYETPNVEFVNDDEDLTLVSYFRDTTESENHQTRIRVINSDLKEVSSNQFQRDTIDFTPTSIIQVRDNYILSVIESFDRNNFILTSINKELELEWEFRELSSLNGTFSNTVKLNNNCFSFMGSIPTVDQVQNLNYFKISTKALLNSTNDKNACLSTIYPNPVNEYLNIDVPKSEVLIKSNIIDIKGRVRDSFHNERTIKIIPSLETGIYFLHLSYRSNKSEIIRLFIN